MFKNFFIYLSLLKQRKIKYWKYIYIFFISTIFLLVSAYFMNKAFLLYFFLWKYNINNNTEQNIEIWDSLNLLNKTKEEKKQNNNASISLVSNNNTIKTNKTTNSNIDSSINSVIILNQLTLSEKPYIEYLNTYINNLKIQWLNDYKFYLIKGKNNIWTCWNTFAWEEKTSFDIFNIIKDIDYIESIRAFKKISSKDKTAKLFIIWDSVSTLCNNDLNINWLKNEIWSANINIFIIWTENQNDPNNIIKDSFFKKLSLELWIQYIKIKSPWEFSNLINTKLYPLELWNGNLINQTINTEILFYDNDWNSTSVTTTVYQKKWSIFNKYWEYVNDWLLQLSLLPWIYYFEMVDNIKWIKVKTEPKTINDTLKYKEKIFFRKTKLNINVLNEQKDPVLSNITIKDLNNWWFILKDIKNTSSLIEELNPWKYELEVKTFDKFIFKDTLELFWQTNIDKEYLTKKWKVQINVKNEIWNIKDNVIVKIYNWNNEQVFVWNGWKIETELWWGTYNVSVEDATSWNIIKDTFTLSANVPSESIDVIFKSIQVVLDIWDTPKMLRFYYNKDYELLPENADEKRKLAFKNISWSWKMKVNLMMWDYVIELFDFNNQYIWNKKISVDDMNSTTFTLYD